MGTLDETCKDRYDGHKPGRPRANPPVNLLFEPFLEPRRGAFRGQLFRLTAAQLAKEILFRFKGPAGELPLMAVIAAFVRTAVAPVAVYDSSMSVT